MLTLAAVSDEQRAISYAKDLAASHPGLCIAVLFDVAKEPWPFRIIAFAPGREVDWPTGVNLVRLFDTQLELKVPVRP